MPSERSSTKTWPNAFNSRCPKIAQYNEKLTIAPIRWRNSSSLFAPSIWACEAKCWFYAISSSFRPNAPRIRGQLAWSFFWLWWKAICCSFNWPSMISICSYFLDLLSHWLCSTYDWFSRFTERVRRVFNIVTSLLTLLAFNLFIFTFSKLFSISSAYRRY